MNVEMCSFLHDLVVVEMFDLEAFGFELRHYCVQIGDAAEQDYPRFAGVGEKRLGEKKLSGSRIVCPLS